MNERITQLLRERRERLDASELDASSLDVDPKLAHFASVMEYYTNTMMAAEAGDQAILDPADADEIIKHSRLLDDIAQDEPSLIAGPVDQGRQQWIATARQAPTPDTSRFVAPVDAEPIPSTKPFHLGLYTSTATHHGQSMWRAYLDPYRGSDLHPLPWHIWNLRAAGSVLEITSASQWAAFIQAYATINDGLIYPDWRRIAQDYDGVHMTARAATATQGINFVTPAGLTAATYWDIESTLWLRWCFTALSLEEVITG